MTIFVQLHSTSQGEAGGSTELNLTKKEFCSSVKSKSEDSAVRLDLNPGSATLQLCGFEQTAYSLSVL